MKNFVFRFYIGSDFACDSIYAECEADAIKEFLSRLSPSASVMMRGLTILVFDGED